MMTRAKNTARIVALLLLFPSAATAQSPPADVGRLLDQALKKQTIRGSAVPDVLATMCGQVGLKISMDAWSANLLPSGAGTRINDIDVPEGTPLRSLLSQILFRLGMTYEIGDDGLVVVATQPLRRINRRATWDELKLLHRCFDLEYSSENFKDFKLQYKITSKVDAPALLRNQLSKAGRGSVAEVLEVAASALGWVWYPDGDHIRFRSYHAQVANYLSRQISARYENQPLARILIDLANKAETPINFEPGMMLKLPPSTANGYTLLLQRTSIRQALELISAETGLTWKIRRDGLHVGLSDLVAGAEGAARRRNSPYVGKISVPSADGTYTFDILIRGDELPEDLLEHRRQLIEEYIQKMRDDMAPDNAVQSSGEQD
ncbi:MAG: hypothetical protein MI923_29285 [Phycisphaerales bacterium]|nr:hypothetical protein [Phycisphaerales bacterium]